MVQLPAITAPHPHAPWPPPALQAELKELSAQRNTDISIRGKTGPIDELEEQFKAFLDDEVRYAISFNAGTSALFAAYFALGIEAGDEVIGPALTYHAALSPLFVLRANPVLVDIDIDTRCIDPAKIEEKITPKTKAITVVHQWGHPADMDAILDIARRHDLYVVEDCSHAHGSRYKGQLCGTFGDVAAFSLQTKKAVFAGEGGMLVTNNATIHDRATLLGHYRDRSHKEITNPDLHTYWVTGFGLKLRMSPFNAIVAKHSLQHFPTIAAERNQCLSYFAQGLADIPYIVPPHRAAHVEMGAWYGFKPLYKSECIGGLPRAAAVKHLRQTGMTVKAPSGPSLASLPLYASAQNPLFATPSDWQPNQPDDFPVAQQVEREALSLPTFYDWERDKPIIDQYLDAFQALYTHHAG